MTMTDFLKLLIKICAEKTRKDESAAQLFSDERAEIMVYKTIAGYIEVFLKDYAEQKKLTNEAEKSFLYSIETDVRRTFDDPVKLIEHINEIASRPPFFDSARISLAAISGFCSDFIHQNNKEIYQEKLQNAPF